MKRCREREPLGLSKTKYTVEKEDIYIGLMCCVKSIKTPQLFNDNYCVSTPNCLLCYQVVSNLQPTKVMLFNIQVSFSKDRNCGIDFEPQCCVSIFRAQPHG